MRVLVTGASGFIGSHVCGALAEAGAEVRGFSRREPPPWARLAEWARGDVADPAALLSAVAGCEAVVHVAALYSYARSAAPELERVNVEGTRLVCDAARRAGARRVLLTSSSATCGPVVGRAATEDDRPPEWELAVPYKRTKLDAERAALAAAAPGFDVVAVNPTTTVGPLDLSPTPSGKMVRDLVEGRIRAYVRGAGLNVVSVDDVATGHRLALEHGRSGTRYILGGDDLPMRDVFRTVLAAIGREHPIVPVPWTVPYRLAQVTDVASRITGREPRLLLLDEVKLARAPLFFSSERARRELGYAPGPAVDALVAAAEWFAGRRRPGWLDRAIAATRLAASGRVSLRSGGGAG